MSIHQEAVIRASPEQIFEYLTSGEIFSAATEQPAQVSDGEGEPFSLLGGRVEGRQIELVPGECVVQVWRFGSAHPDAWAPGVYSIVRFMLRPEDDATRFVIDQTGFRPSGRITSRAGYPTFYQAPLARHFGG